MTITLSSGLAVRIPNSQFLPTHIDTANDGSRVYDDSIREFLYNAVGDQPATLGRYFFTSAHLTVNHDANSFTLSEARATTDSDLVPIVSNPTSDICTETGADSGGTKQTPTAAIAGGVVGGVVAVLAAAGIAFVLWRRRRRQYNSYEVPVGSVSDENNKQDKSPETHELGGYQKPSELSGYAVQGQQHSGQVYEMSNDTQIVAEVGNSR